MVLFEIIDGDERSATEIATNSGFIKDNVKDYDKINSIIDQVLSEKADIVAKIRKQTAKKSKKGGPVMFLVGESMKRLKAQGEPEYVQKYIRKQIFGSED